MTHPALQAPPPWLERDPNRPDPAPIKRVLERRLGGGWQVHELGLDSWAFSHSPSHTSVIVSAAVHGDAGGHVWLHASIAHPDTDPTYAEMVVLKEAAFGPDRFAYQVFPARAEHVSIHDHALHLWGRLDGTNVLPSFGAKGTI